MDVSVICTWRVHFSSDFDGFLAYLAKGNVSFCHHLVSVVLTSDILIFSSETAEPYRRNLVGSIYGRYSIKIAHFVPIR